MTTVPDKYAAEPRQWEKKEWLYEQYWVKMLTLAEIAERTDVGRRAIREQLKEHGIPKRLPYYRRDNAVSPFAGFYKTESAPVDDATVAFDGDHKERGNGNENPESDWANGQVTGVESAVAHDQAHGS